MEEPVAQGEDPAGLVGRHLDLVELSALLARADEVLERSSIHLTARPSRIAA